MGDSLRVVRFEDLKAETDTVVRGITQFLGICATKEEIETAVNEARLANVRKIEKKRWQQQRRGTPTNMSTFYRGGVTGQWKEYFSESESQVFLENSSEALRLAGYAT